MLASDQRWMIYACDDNDAHAATATAALSGIQNRSASCSVYAINKLVCIMSTDGFNDFLRVNELYERRVFDPSYAYVTVTICEIQI